jgi:hypothetical protein
MADGFHGNLRFGPFELSSRERVQGISVQLGSRSFKNHLSNCGIRQLTLMRWTIIDDHCFRCQSRRQI